MNRAALEQQAQQEIGRRLDGLCSSEEARHKMQALALVFAATADERQSGTPSEQRAAGVLLSAAVYLQASLARPELDGKVLLDTVNSLCWDKRYEAGESLPEDLQQEFEEASVSASQLLHLWQKSMELGHEPPMTELLMWWTVATLVSEAVHLDEGEASLTLEPLLRQDLWREQGASNCSDTGCAVWNNMERFLRNVMEFSAIRMTPLCATFARGLLLDGLTVRRVAAQENGR